MLNARYTYSLRVRLSKNYNSIETGVEYGREAAPGESKAHLIQDVEETVQAQAEAATHKIADMLGLVVTDIKEKGHKGAKR